MADMKQKLTDNSRDSTSLVSTAHAEYQDCSRKHNRDSVDQGRKKKRKQEDKVDKILTDCLEENRLTGKEDVQDQTVTNLVDPENPYRDSTMTHSSLKDDKKKSKMKRKDRGSEMKDVQQSDDNFSRKLKKKKKVQT